MSELDFALRLNALLPLCLTGRYYHRKADRICVLARVDTHTRSKLKEAHRVYSRLRLPSSSFSFDLFGKLRVSVQANFCYYDLLEDCENAGLTLETDKKMCEFLLSVFDGSPSSQVAWGVKETYGNWCLRFARETDGQGIVFTKEITDA